MSKPTVIVDPSFRRMNEIFSPVDRQRLHDMVNVVWGKDEPMPVDQFVAALPEAEVVICTDWTRYGDVLPQAKKLRAIFGVSGAYPLGLDYPYCFARGIRVLSIAPTFARQVAEMALGMAISLCRDIGGGDRAMKAGTEQWLWGGNVGTYMLYDKPVGFIGFGAIARALYPLLKPFNVTASAYDPWISESYLRKQGVRPTTLEDVMKSSRVVFVLAAPTSENRALISRQLMERLKPESVFVLVSRAHVVDFDALADLVLAKRFRAGIDVFPQEPIPLDHPIRSAGDNVILSAHRAGSVEEGLWEIGEAVLDDLELVLRGLPPQFLPSADPALVQRYALMNTYVAAVADEQETE